MKLSLEQIISSIEKPKASGILSDAMVSQTKHKLHLVGTGFEDTLDRLDGVESEHQNKLKKKIAQPTTTRIYKQILNQFKKTFRASGFFRGYKFSDGNENLEADFINYLKDIGGGLSIQELMSIAWFKAVFEDFNGLFIVELPEQQFGEFAEPFVRFMNTESIHDIYVNGQNIEYVIFTWETKEKNKKTKHFRVIDDAFDYHLIMDNGKVKLATIEVIDESGNLVQQSDVIPNIWGYVPCIQPSQLNKSIDNDTLKKSYIEETLSNADNYLSISNSHSVSVKLHQHPIFYSFPVTCPTCNGSQYISSKDGDQIDCGTCHGEGKVPFYKKDPSLGITLPEPEADQQMKAEAPCGYVTPDLESLKEQREEMRVEESLIEKGVFGMEGVLSLSSKNETATGKELDLQPLVDLLSDFSMNGEMVEEFITDAIGIARYNDTNTTGQRYEGSTINWGKRFFVKSTFMIEEEYKNAKIAGIPNSTLNEILDELIHTKYENNPNALKRSLILKEIEPFPTYTAMELLELGVDAIDLNIKIYFNDYIERFEREYAELLVYKSGLDFSKKVDEIKEIIKGYAVDKMPKPLTPSISLQDELSIEERMARGVLSKEKALELRNKTLNN